MESGLLLMVVDDCPADLYSSERAIRDATGFGDVLMATNGVSTLEVLEERIGQELDPPALIFLDLRMPEMNGFEFLIEFERLYPSTTTQVVVLSGTDHPVEKTHALEHECVVGYSVKPVQVKDVEHHIEKWVSEHVMGVDGSRASLLPVAG
ncbi:MAG: two-component system response regulator [Polyangiales bacterium]